MKKYNSIKDKNKRLKRNKKIIENFYAIVPKKEDQEYYIMIKTELENYIKDKEFYTE